MSTEVEKKESSVPALAQTPAFDIGTEDVALPRLYLGQYMSDHVKEDRVPKGCVFTATGPEDDDPQTLWTGEKDEPVRVHVLSLERGKSASVDGELEMYAFDDPDAPAEAWTTYNYVVCLPDVDETLPFKWLLTRTGQQAAKNINLVVMRNEKDHPAYANAFDLTAKKRSNAKGEFFVPRVKPVEADPEHVKIAAEMATMLSGVSAEVKATGEAPAI
jgi:hypothetical protein